MKDAVVVHSREELLKELEQYRSEDIYIIGGESVYRMMLPYCDVAHVTKIDHVYEADAYFPDLDQDQEWDRDPDRYRDRWYSRRYLRNRVCIREV